MKKRAWTATFRQATDQSPSGRTPILGPARCTAEEMRDYIARRNPEAPDLAALYIAAGERHGVRGDLAYCHAVQETNAWRGRGAGGSAASLEWLAGGPDWREWEARDGEAAERTVESHMRRLLRYAAPERLASEAQDGHGASQSRPAIRRRWTYWEELDGLWHPARRDGSGTVAIWRRMLEWTGKGGANRVSGINGWIGTEQLSGIRSDERQEAQARRASSPEDERELQWLRARGLLQQPAPAPGQAVTWAELAGLLRRLEEATERLGAAEAGAPEAGVPEGEAD
ncbi:hypothetical protein [Cohnella sp. 56]|uniref:hypothetical protein n=1 Tax=Cohnella sp. 56 TaxID=3113722 RepID=UPI0030EA06B3